MKLNAVLITIIGVVLILNALGMSLGALLDKWTIPILVLAVGIAKLVVNFGGKKKR